jgi:hypothetical protein
MHRKYLVAHRIFHRLGNDSAGYAWYLCRKLTEWTARRPDGTRRANRVRGERTAGGAMARSQAVGRAEGTWQPESRWDEHTAGAASGEHAAAGMSARRAHSRCGELITCGERIVGGTGTPPSLRADTTRRPQSWRGVHTVGTASGWHPATGKSAV